MNVQALISVRDFVRIEVLDYEFPHLADCWDGNWLKATFEVKDNLSRLQFSGSHVRADELQRFSSSLRAILDGKLTKAALSPMERLYDLMFRKSDELGHYQMNFHFDSLLCGGPEPSMSKHEYFFGIDQTDIRILAQQIDRVLDLFPVRQNPR